MGKTVLSFVLRMLMVCMVALAALQLMALVAGTSPLLQTILVVFASVALTYYMAVLDGRLMRAQVRRRRAKARLQVAMPGDTIRVA